jgi:hypothetical protein
MRMIDLHCLACGGVCEVLQRSGDALACRLCESLHVERIFTRGPTTRPDEIPGGIQIAHGLCNEDGTPRTYYSRSEIKMAAAVKGLVSWSEVYTEDRTKDARVRDEWLKSSEAKRAKRDRDEARAEKRLARDRAERR